MHRRYHAGCVAVDITPGLFLAPTVAVSSLMWDILSRQGGDSIKVCMRSCFDIQPPLPLGPHRTSRRNLLWLPSSCLRCYSRPCSCCRVGVSHRVLHSPRPTDCFHNHLSSFSMVILSVSRLFTCMATFLPPWITPCLVRRGHLSIG